MLIFGVRTRFTKFFLHLITLTLKIVGDYALVKATNSKLLGTKILEIFDFFEYLT